MENKLLSCPLCLHPHFTSIDSLRTALVNVASAPIPCAICNEVLMGLDKFTIHLFSHITFTITITTGSNAEASQLGTATSFYLQKKIVTLVQSPKAEEKVLEQPKQPIISEEIRETENTSSDSSTIQCDICNFRFNDKSILEMHHNLLHQTLADSKTGACSYHCHICSKRFKMKGSLMVHLRVAHAGFGCQTSQSQRDSCHKSPNTDNIQVVGGVKQWGCDICEKTFTTKYFLKKHKRLHTGEMPYNCSQCNKSFTFQQSFHKHMMYHTADKPHVCLECNRAFKELSTLQNHQRIHSGERPFACETCGKCFRQRVSYLVHRRIHTGVMPYTCNICNKSFRYKVSQKSHKCTVTLNNGGETELISTNAQSDHQCSASTNVKTNRQHAPISRSDNNDSNERPDLSSNEIFQVTSNVDGTAYYAMVLSPTSTSLPDVQSLCLSSDSVQLASKEYEEGDNSRFMLGRSKTIDEESLKQLLYGSVQ